MTDQKPTLTIGMAGRQLQVTRNPDFDPKKESTPIYDRVARMFQWSPLADGSDCGPKNRLATKKGHKPKRRRSE